MKGKRSGLYWTGKTPGTACEADEERSGSAQGRADGKKHLAFNGEEKELRFVAPLSVAQKSGGFYVVEIEHVQQDEGGMLVMHYHRYHHNDDSFEDIVSNDIELLLDNVEDISFRYYGPDYEKGVSDWSSQWKEQTVLPYKIEMHVINSNQAGSGNDYVLTLGDIHDPGDDPGSWAF